jgi:hypothetical protein
MNEKTTNKKFLVKTLVALSIILNLILVSYFVQVTLFILGDNSDSGSTSSKDAPSPESRVKNSISYNQLFYGTWKVIEPIPADAPLPSRYSGFDSEGNFRGPDYTPILGKQITFGESYVNEGENDYYVEWDGQRQYLVYGFRTYTHPLFSEEDFIGYHYAKTLGVTGNYHSIVYFILPNNFIAKHYEPDRPNEIHVSDLCFLYLKDDNTIYASDGGLLFLLERVGDPPPRVFRN